MTATINRVMHHTICTHSRLVACQLLSATALLTACQQDKLWDDKSFDTLVSADSALPYKTEQPLPQPGEAKRTESPFGDNPRDLAFLVSYALENNPDTKAIWERAKATAAQWARMESLWWPQVHATGFAGYSQNAIQSQTGLDTFTGPIGNMGAELTWELIDFGRRDAQTDAARRALEAANLGFNRSLQQLVFDVQTAYYILDSKIALEQTAEQNVETNRIQMDAVDDRLRVGLATMPDVLVSRQRWEQARFTLEAAKSATFDARGLLARRLGLPADAPIEIVSLQKVPIPETLGDKVERLMAVGAADRPDLLAAGQRVREAEARIKKADADFLPTLSLFGGFSNTFSNYEPSPVTNNTKYDINMLNYAAGLKGSWLLFDGFERVNAVREARSLRNAAVSDLTRLKLEVLSDVWNAYFAQLAAERQYTFGESLLAASQESYDGMFEAYVNGLRTLPELLQSELDLMAARSTLIRTRAELLDSAAKLAFAVGSPDTASRYAKKVDPRGDIKSTRE